MISSDIIPGLWSKIKHGRILNIEKAISFFTDILIVHDDQLNANRTIFGKISFRTANIGDPVDLCPDVRVDRSNIWKIARVGKMADFPEADNFLVYINEKTQVDPLEPIQTKWCNQLISQISIEDALTGETLTIENNSNIIDIVMSEHTN